MTKQRNATVLLSARQLLPSLLGLLVLAALVVAPAAQAVTPAVSAGGNHSGALKPDGSLWGWGSNSWGQLGVESLAPLDVPTAVINGSPFVKQAKGFEHTVAIKGDGTLWAWGRNYEGQFGNGTTSPSLHPIPTGDVAPVDGTPDSDWVDVKTGERHTLALKADGTLWAWGQNDFGQLGDGSQLTRSTPVQIPLPVGSLPGDKWFAMAAGYKFSLAIRDSDRKLFAWGYNFEGQLGDGTTTNRLSPREVFSTSAWAQVAAGAGQVLAIDAAGHLWTWGSDAFGEMGDGPAVGGAQTPWELSSESWTKVAAGGRHSGAIKGDGTLWLWGSNLDGQIGDGNSGAGVSQTFPLQIGNDLDWIDLACGDAHTVGLRGNNNLLSWGNNGAGQVGSQVLYGAGAVPDPQVTIADITDVTPPFLTIDTFTYLTNATSQTIGGAVETADNDVEIWLNGSATPQGIATLDLTDPANPRWTFLLNGLIAGNNSVRATTLDAGSNPTEKTVGIFLDQAKPTVAMAPSFLTNQLTALISGAFTEDQLIGGISIFSALDAINCIDSVAIVGSTWSCTVDGLVAGPSNPFSVVAVDFAGNTSNPVVSNIVVDLVAPTAPTVSGTAFTTALRPTWNWLSTDASGNDLFRYQLDGGGYVETLATTFTPAVDFAEGSHTLLVQERDAAGNWSLDGASEIFVDITAPVVNVTSPAPGERTRAPVLAYTAGDVAGSGVATVDVAIDGAVPQSIASGTALTLADGLHSVEVSATDMAGNASAWANVAFTVDTVPPFLEDLGVDVYTNDPSRTFVLFGRTETGATVTVSPTPGTGGGATVLPDDSWFFLLSGLPEGPTVVSVMARDVAGNETQDSFAVIYDSTLPSVSVNPVSTPSKVVNQTISGTMESGATIMVTVDTPATVVGAVSYPTATTWSCLLSGLVEGANLVTVTASDAATNAASVNTTIVLDTTPPGVTVDAVVTPTNQTNQTVSGTRESGATVAVVAPSASPGAVTYPTGTTWSCPISSLVEGANLVTVIATDAATNAASVNATIILDTTPPSVGVNAVTTPTNQTSQIVSGTRESGATVAVVAPSASPGAVTYPTGTTWSCPISGLAEGTNLVTVTATDAATNAASVNTTIVLDTIAPSVAIDPAPTSPTNDSSPLLRGSREDGATIALSADTTSIFGPMFYPTATTWRCGVSSLLEGPNVITVTATDAATNAASVNTTIVLDTVAPGVTVDAVVTPTNQTSQTVTGTMEVGASVAVVVPSASPGAVTYPTATTWSCPISGLVEGANLITVTATDAATNTASVNATIVLDTVAPNVTLNPIATPTNLADQTVSGSREDGASVTVTIDTAASPGTVTYPTATTWSCPITGFVAGPNLLTITAIDAATNVGSVPATVVFDITAPNLTLDPVASPTNQTSQTVSGSMEAGATITVIAPSANAGAVTNPTATTWSCPITGLVEGDNVVTVTVTDSASNQAMLAVTIVLDTVAPGVTLNAVATPTNQADQTVSGTMESGATVTVAVDTTAIPGFVTYPTATTWTCSLTGLVEGPNLITVTATDAAGNAASDFMSVVLDSTAPNVSLNPFVALTNQSSQTLSGTMESGATVTVAGVTATNLTATTWQYLLTGLSEGVNNITVTATDLAGNPALSEIIATITLDTVAPGVTVTPLPPTNQADQVVSGTMESGAIVSVVVDTAATAGTVTYPSPTTWECPVTGLSAGDNIVTVTATDAATNAASVTTTIVFDTIPPDVTIDPPASPTNLAIQTVSGTMESGATVTVTVNMIATAAAASYPTATTWSCQISGLVEGANVVTVTATDTATNAASVTALIVLDTAAPSVTLDPFASPTNLTSQTLTGTRESGAIVNVVAPSLTVGPVTTPTLTTWSCLLSNLAAGANPFTITVTDAALNPGNPVSSSIFLAGMEVRQMVIDGTSRTLPPIAIPMNNPVLIVGPPTVQDAEAGMVRVVRNTLANSFDLRFAEWSTPTGAHGSEDVTCLLLEAGRYTMTDGTIWEVGTFKLAGNNFQTFSFASPFLAAPALFLTLQSENDSLPVSLRTRNVSGIGFDVSMTHAEASWSITHREETVGYLAIYAPPTGSGTADFGALSFPYLTQNTASLSDVWTPVASRVLRLEEETTLDAETAHASETVHTLAIGPGVFAQVASINQSDPVALRQQSAVATAPVVFGSLRLTGSGWVRIPFGQQFSRIPVVVVKPLSKAVGNAGFVQIQNVTTTTFEVRYSEWDGGAPPAQIDAFYLAAEEGPQTFAGLQLQAGFTTLSGPLNSTFSNSTTLSFPSPFVGSQPALFASVQTATDAADPVISRLMSVTTNGFSIGMQEPLNGDGIHVGETVGWIAVQQGTGQLADGRTLRAFIDSAADVPTPLSFSATFASTYTSTLVSPQFARLFPNVARALGQNSFANQVQGRAPILLADMHTANDVDPAVVRFANLSNVAVDLIVEEEPPTVGVATHQAEEVSLLLLQ